MKKFFSVFLLTAVLAAPLPVLAQRSSAKPKSLASTAAARGADLITTAQLRDYLSFIAADEMEGRDTPSRGLDTIAKFIAMNLSRWGFKPAGDDGSYLQRIVLRRDQLDAAASSAEINGQKFTFGEDFLPTAVPATISGPLVYVGHGWMIKAKNIDSYKGVDVKDKIIVVFGEGLPKGVRQTDLTGTRGEDWANPLLYAQRHGALGVLAIPDAAMLSNWERIRQRAATRGATIVEKFQTPTGRPVPAIWLSTNMATALFQGEKQEASSLLTQGNAGEAIEPFELSPGKKVTFTVGVKQEKMQTQNVLGVFEGSHPVLKNEYVALGAHYDHVGTGAAVNGDTIYNGADDDGSGTTALLAMAETLARVKSRPKRSVLFVWHAGEEKGLWGSRYFTENPTIPLDRIVTQLNLDMIGRSKKEGDTAPRNKDLSGPNQVYVIGSKMMSTKLGDLTEAVNKSYLNLTYDYRYDDPADPNRFFFRSDHVNYARKGIPIVFFFDGVHEDYHGRGDTADKIDYEKMGKITRTIYMMMWEIANLPTRPKVDKPLPPQLAPRTR